jgi:hypothetical protein
MLPSAGAFLLALGLVLLFKYVCWIYRRELGVERGVDRRVISCS